MLVIRLRRIGKKKFPAYRLVVAEHSMPVGGKFVEDVGFYNPRTKATGLKKDEILTWLKKGAQPSNTVAKILTKEKLKHDSIKVVKYHKKARSAKADKTAPAPSAAPATETVAAVDQPETETKEEPATPNVAEEPAPVADPEPQN